MRCGYCKKLTETEKEQPPKIGGVDACQSCATKAILIDIRQGDAILERVWRVPKVAGRQRYVKYKGVLYKLLEGNHIQMK